MILIENFLRLARHFSYSWLSGDSGVSSGVSSSGLSGVSGVDGGQLQISSVMSGKLSLSMLGVTGACSMGWPWSSRCILL